ncbi:MAG TPA: DNA-directed RNA polymerase subunit omega [Ignavibacteria bacterium]|nr:DNA-directed RNA polymerase subunit omega [Ignavibacteria bacterium]HMR39653.1 DNA-directed RNA polymerase subunit omega [Ignavibacteria bacterium]
MSIETLDLDKFESKTANLYESIVVASKKARQINDAIKMELNQRLEPIIAKETEDDSIMNQDKLNISLEFEKREKPTIEAIDNLMEDKVNYRFKNENEEEVK